MESIFKKTTLKNGLRIITAPQKGAQAVTVLVLVGAGSKYEKKEINGISHFLEHMFFKGTKKRPNTQAISEALDRVGGNYNAFTGEEYTGFYAKVDASHTDLAMDVISDILLNSKFETKEMEKEKKVIFEEINMQYDHPMSYVQLLWAELLYGDQPAGWNIAGTKETVAGITRQNILNYLERQYGAQNMLVCVAGNVLVPQIENKVKKYFAGLKVADPIPKLKVREKQTKPDCLTREKETDQTHLCLGFRGYDLFHPQKYAYELLGIILGGMMSSRMFIEVREKLGLAYYVRASADSSTDAGFLVTQAGVDNKNVELAISTILREYKKIAREKVPSKELKKAKDYIKGKTLISLESSDAQASFFGMQELLEKKMLTPEEIFKKIDQVAPAQILAVARDIIKPEKLNLALIGPFQEKNKLSNLLKI